MGRTLRVGAGVGRRRMDLARPGRRPHVEDPPRHDAHTTVTPPPVGTRRPGRHRRPAVERTRHVVGRTRRDRLGVRQVRRGMRQTGAGRTDGRVPRHHVRAVGRPAVLVLRRALHDRADGVPDARQHGAAAAGTDLVRRRDRAPEVDGSGLPLGRGDPPGDGRRRRPPPQPRRDRAAARRDHRRGRRSAVRHRHRGLDGRALPGIVRRRRRDLVDRVDVGRDERALPRCRRQRSSPPGPPEL